MSRRQLRGGILIAWTPFGSGFRFARCVDEPD
jgi:hypothetical protein